MTLTRGRRKTMKIWGWKKVEGEGMICQYMFNDIE
jgi:hypothetical protein